jgi:hypothetical protein
MRILVYVSLLIVIATVVPKMPKAGLAGKGIADEAQQASKPQNHKQIAHPDQNGALAVSQTSAANNPNHQESEKKEMDIPRYMLWFTGLLALADILQFAILVWTFWQMRDTAQRELRAYVCVDSSALKFPAKNMVDVQVHFKNCGKTPAYDLEGWIHTWLAEYPLSEVLPAAPDSLRKGKEPLAPGRQSIHVAARVKLEKLTEMIIGTPACTLYVYGEVQYRDAFRKKRRTKYRLIYGGNEGNRSIQGKDGAELWLLKPDTEGNEAD